MGPPGGTRSRKTATYPRTPQRHGMGSSHGHANPSLSHPRFSSLSLSAAFREADPQPTLSLPRMVAFVSPVSASSSRMRRPRSARHCRSMFFTFQKDSRTIVFYFPKTTRRRRRKHSFVPSKNTRKIPGKVLHNVGNPVVFPTVHSMFLTLEKTHPCGGGESQFQAPSSRRVRKRHTGKTLDLPCVNAL